MVKKEMHPGFINRKPIRPIERQKMRPWLLNLLQNENVPGLAWLSKRDRSFRISWRHAARQGWNPKKDADLFERWARHTGKFMEGDEPDPKKWKANFRCALNSLPDVKELKDQGIRKGQNAFKVYILMDEKRMKCTSTKLTSAAESRIHKSERPRRTTKPNRKYRDSLSSDAEEDMYSDNSKCNSLSDCDSHDDTSASDSESLPERSRRCSSSSSCTEFPVFDKICDYKLELKSPDEETIPTPQTSSMDIADFIKTNTTSTPDFDASSTTSASSSLTDEEVLVLLDDLRQDDTYTSQYWNADFVPDIAMEEDVETTYVVLQPAVDDYQVVSETDAVRTELQMSAETEIVYTSIGNL